MSNIKKNILYNIVYQILLLIVPLVTTPYISRILLPEGVGTYSVTTAIAKYFWLFCLLGMTNYGNRTIAKARGSKRELSITFWNLFSFQAIVSLIGILAFGLYVFLWGYDHYDKAILCQLPYVLSAMVEVGWFFSGTEQFRFMVIRNAVIKLLSTIAVFLFVKTAQDIWIYISITSISLLLGQICLWPYLLRQVEPIRPCWEQISKHLKPNLILFTSVVAVSIYTLMDKLMIEWMGSRSHVGFYENTEKIFTLCISLIGAVGAVMLPRISFLVEKKSKESVHTYLSRSMVYIMSLAVAMAFGLAGISKEFSVVFFGDSFAQCGVMISVIAIAVVFYSWENILRTQYLLPNEKDGIFVKGTICAAVVNLLLNALFIPRWGALGAVIGTVGAQMAEAIYQSVSVRKELPLFSYVKGIVPSILCGAVMYGICRVIGMQGGAKVTTVLLQIGIGAIVFILLQGTWWLITGDEIVLGTLKRVKGHK